MTPTRAKRNSRVPERFSSDTHGLELSGKTGETILDYRDKSTTHKITAVGATKIKLKPVIREPLKVKLPKSRRHQHTLFQSSKDVTKLAPKIANAEVKIHKIKLPSLASRKSKGNGSEPNVNHSTLTSTKLPDINTNDETREKQQTGAPREFLHHGDEKQSGIDNSQPRGIEESTLTANLNESSLSSFSDDNKPAESSSANTSLSSDEANTSGMQIIVNTNHKTDSTNDSGIKCPCGVNDDIGVMVECEKCSTWQHGHCINVGNEDDAYEGYICAYCTLPPDKHEESLRQLTVGDKFQLRFELLGSLKDRVDQGKIDSSELTGKVNFTVDELNQALQDLKRVTNSLRAKWRLLASSNYDPELKIWQQPIWSADPHDILNQNKTKYFLDAFKDNLRLNIRNMVSELAKRCKLINFHISLTKTSINENHQQKYEKIDQSIREIQQAIDEYGSKLTDLQQI